jgi:hypothetical protein
MRADGSPGGATFADRDNFIPVRKLDILDALIGQGVLADAQERERFRQLCRLLGAIYHYQYFERLEKLRSAYYYFNPEIDLHARCVRGLLDQSYAELVAQLTAVLKGANFIEMTHAEIEAAHRERVVGRVEVRAPRDEFREVRFFKRGRHKEAFETAAWFGLRKRKIAATVHDDVVLFVAMKQASELPAHRLRRRHIQRRMRPGSVLIKYFRNIADWDLHALYPDVRVVMTTLDKLFLSGPAVLGAIPILLKLATTLTVLFVVIGFYLGLEGAVHDDDMKTALAAISGVAALVGFVLRQWLRYQRQALRYQKELTDNIYFRNVNNNVGIFDTIIGAAEEQECKEAFLAYYFLRTAKAPPTPAELDSCIETWLSQTFSVDVDFEVDDALGKLERLGLLRRDGDRLSVLPPKEALARLDDVWDNYFQFNVAGVAAEKI